MRPYMLWLARVYAGQTVGYGTAFHSWPNVLSDWARRLREHEFERASYRPREPRATTSQLDLAYRKGMTTGSRNHAARLREHLRREAAAAQGGR